MEHLHVAVEPPRLLRAHSELGYTNVVSLAMHDEPEAVPEQTQIELSRAARERESARLHADARRCLDSMRPALDELVRVAGRELGADVRALVRDFDRVERRVA